MSPLEQPREAQPDEIEKLQAARPYGEQAISIASILREDKVAVQPIRNESKNEANSLRLNLMYEVKSILGDDFEFHTRMRPDEDNPGSWLLFFSHKPFSRPLRRTRNSE